MFPVAIQSLPAKGKDCHGANAHVHSHQCCLLSLSRVTLSLSRVPEPFMEKHCGPTNFPSSHHRPISRKPFSHACGRKRRYEVGTTDPTLFHGAVLPGKHTHTHTHGESTQRKADSAPCSKAPVRFAFFIQLHFLSLSLSDFHNRSLDYLSSSVSPIS